MLVLLVTWYAERAPRECQCKLSLQVSGNHRLDDSKSEQERIKAAGFEVSTSTVEGKPCGPLRVWPGGLAMSRTLGDFEVSWRTPTPRPCSPYCGHESCRCCQHFHGSMASTRGHVSAFVEDGSGHVDCRYEDVLHAC